MCKITETSIQKNEDLLYIFIFINVFITLQIFIEKIMFFCIYFYIKSAVIKEKFSMWEIDPLGFTNKEDMTVLKS